MNETLVLEDVRRHLPNISRTRFRRLVAYAVAGAGFDNMDKIVRDLGEDDLQRLKVLLKKWMGSRNHSAFFQTLFGDYGYTYDDASAG